MHLLDGQTQIALAPLVLWFALLCIKHVLGDFYFQPTWMALSKERATGWFWPLLAHGAIHGTCTTLLLLALQPRFWALGLVDFAVHTIIDRCKGLILGRRNLTPSDRPFWAILGIDQTLHHLTGFALAITIAAGA